MDVDIDARAVGREDVREIGAAVAVEVTGKPRRRIDSATLSSVPAVDRSKATAGGTPRPIIQRAGGGVRVDEGDVVGRPFGVKLACEKVLARVPATTPGRPPVGCRVAVSMEIRVDVNGTVPVRVHVGDVREPVPVVVSGDGLVV